MGARGPLPKPTILKALEGNPGHRPLNENEPKPKPGVGEPPDELLPEALEEWNRVRPEVERIELVTSLDRNHLIAACQEWARYRRCMRTLKELGETYAEPDGYGNVKTIPRPEVKIARDCLNTYRAYARELGFSPAARGGLKIHPPADKNRLDLD